MIMLSSTSYLLLTLLISSTLADLTCLQWAFVSPLVSAICYFSPKTASKVEAAAIEGIKTAIDDAKELIEFDLKHMPITVAYNYATIAHNAGWSSANEYAKNTTADYGEVSIGFGKESVNQAYSLFNLLEWNDYTYCIIKGAVKNAKGGSNKRSRGLVKKRAISDIDAAGIAKRCLSDKFSKGPVFNVSGKWSPYHITKWEHMLIANNSWQRASRRHHLRHRSPVHPRRPRRCRRRQHWDIRHRASRRRGHDPDLQARRGRSRPRRALLQ